MTTLPKTLTLQEAAEMSGVTTERLESLATAGFCPHIVVDDSALLFPLAKFTTWVKHNLWRICEGSALDQPTFAVNQLETADHQSVPIALSSIRELKIMRNPRKVSGVYFLCDHGDVVYVGQSVSVFGRVVEHTDKVYDSVFYIAVHADILDVVERAFIRMLKPKYNRAIVYGDLRSRVVEPEQLLREAGVLEEEGLASHAQ